MPLRLPLPCLLSSRASLLYRGPLVVCCIRHQATYHRTPTQPSTAHSPCYCYYCYSCTRCTSLMHTQRAHLPLFHLPPSPSPFLRAAAARASKCTGMAAPCQRHVSLTRAGVEGFKKCFAKISRGGGVVPTSHRTLIEATTLASLPSLHTESNGPACATTSRVCNTCSHAGPPLQHICVGEKARPWPADDKRAQRFDVVHQPSRLASQTAPPDHQSGHPAATPRRTVKLSSETRLLTNSFLPTPRRTNLC